MATTLGSVAALAAALSLAGTALPAAAATFVYVGCTDSNEIHVLQLNPQNGDLTPVEKVTIPGIAKTAGSTPMAISPDRKFLFAATRGEPMVAASFRIDPATGKLSHIANGPLDGSMAYIATDRSGRFLLAVGQTSNRMSVYAIDGGSGRLAKLADYPMGTNPNWVEIIDLP